AQQWKISREAQDAFALASHQKALAAIQSGEFKNEISPFLIKEQFANLLTGKLDVVTRLMETDEGPRADTSIEGLAKLKTVF
ncbi:hypothetical protein ABTL57_19550, partial [Acinetobacter baumannii]